MSDWDATSVDNMIRDEENTQAGVPTQQQQQQNPQLQQIPLNPLDLNVPNLNALEHLPQNRHLTLG